MMNNGPILITETNISYAWKKAFIEVAKPKISKVIPLIVTIAIPSNNPPVSQLEDVFIRRTLDTALTEKGAFNCETVASTIFPISLWDKNKDRKMLYERYIKLFPDIKKEDFSNRYGTYFQRLICFDDGESKLNQLEHIISIYKDKIHRPTALQASIFDPKRDHTAQVRRGFPCMQHIAFSPYNGDELAITAFYANQYIFERAYGNYLGIYNLGQFMAHEMGLKLTRMTCFASSAMAGEINKNDAQLLIDNMQGYINQSIVMD